MVHASVASAIDNASSGRRRGVLPPRRSRAHCPGRTSKRSGRVADVGRPAVVDLAVQPVEVDALNIVEPAGALLHGRAFAAAVQAGISATGIQSPSILLDGSAFELAVNDAVAFVTNGSALLYGTGFAGAVAKAVNAAKD